MSVNPSLFVSRISTPVPPETQYQRTPWLGLWNLPNAFLHVAAQYNIAIGPRPWDHIRFKVGAMAHHVGSDVLSLGEDDLAPGRKAFRIFDTRKSLRR